MIMITSIFRCGDNTMRQLLFLPSFLASHYTIEFRTYFTNFHITVVGSLGATESLLITIIVTLLHGFYGFEFMEQTLFEVPVLGAISPDFIVLCISSIGGGQYIVQNMIEGVKGANDKMHAFWLSFPTLFTFAYVFCMQYSQLFPSKSAILILAVGFYQTYQTGQLNYYATSA